MRGKELGPVFEQCNERKMMVPESAGGGGVGGSWAVYVRLTSPGNGTGENDARK